MPAPRRYRGSLWTFVVLASALGLSTAEAMAEPASSFRPATLGNGPDSFVARLECPEGGNREGPTIVYCQTEVSESGKTSGAYCFAAERSGQPYVRTTGKSLEASTFQPAAVDGSNVPVYLSLRAVFLWKNDVCRRYVLLNTGEHAGEFGLGYIAPQEILADLGWFWRSRSLGRSAADRGGFTRRGIAFVMSVAVSDEGVASDARVDRNHFGERGHLSKAKRALSKARLIPGFVDGRPHPMRYYEILYIR